MFSPVLPKSVAIILLITGLAMLSPPARALLDESQYTEEEKIGFAFHQLEGLQPDFEKWIISNPKFKVVTPKERHNMLRHDYYRLEHGFYSYAPNEDLITITTKGRLIQHKAPRDQEEGYIKIKFLEGQGTFFTSHIGDLWIAVIPQNIEKFSTLAFKAKEYKKFVGKIGFVADQAPAVIELKLRPIAVDAERPVVIDKKPFWPMLVEIGSMSIWNDDMSTFAWSYEAPWYTPVHRQDFIDLYQQ